VILRVRSLPEDGTPVPKHVGYLKWNVGLVILCVRRLPEDGTPVSKHVGYLKWSDGLVILRVRSLPEDGTPETCWIPEVEPWNCYPVCS
jgi:hypothetical protein